MKKYKITASLLSSYLYYLTDGKKATFRSLTDAVRGIYTPNMFTKMGHDFEDDIFEGKNPKLSPYIAGMPTQIQKYRDIKVGEDLFMISGKLDVYDTENRRILDFKRIIKKDYNKYDDSAQHLLYFYLVPEAEEFVYICAYGPIEEIKDYYIIRKNRPTEEELESSIRKIIVDFITFLKENELLETYIMFQAVEGKK